MPALVNSKVGSFAGTSEELRNHSVAAGGEEVQELGLVRGWVVNRLLLL